MNLLKEVTKPTINLTFESVKVEAETRKLRAVWSPQLAQDLNAFRSIDTIAQIEQCLVNELAGNIDKNIIKDILGGVNLLNEITKKNQAVDCDWGLPVARQVHSKLIASDLVEVRPMSPPSGLLFYIDYINDTPKYIFLIPEKKTNKNQKVWRITK